MNKLIIIYAVLLLSMSACSGHFLTVRGGTKNTIDHNITIGVDIDMLETLCENEYPEIKFPDEEIRKDLILTCVMIG